MTMVPKPIYDRIVKKIFDHTNPAATYHKTKEGMIMTSCDHKKFPTIEFLINGYWVEMLPRDYINKASTEPHSECFLGLTVSSVDFFVFGDTFMRGFYVIHDDPRGLVGLVPNTRSTKSNPVMASGDSLELMKPLDASKIFNLTYEEMQIGTGSILALIALVVLIYKCCKGNKSDDNKKVKDSVDE